jgi:hypothetical protein
VVIPALPQNILVLSDQFQYYIQFAVAESVVRRETYRAQPELRYVVVTLYMYMGRLVVLVAEEEKRIRADSMHHRHRAILYKLTLGNL